jgi:hypothetical protein
LGRLVEEFGFDNNTNESSKRTAYYLFTKKQTNGRGIYGKGSIHPPTTHRAGIMELLIKAGHLNRNQQPRVGYTDTRDTIKQEGGADSQA